MLEGVEWHKPALAATFARLCSSSTSSLTLLTLNGFSIALLDYIEPKLTSLQTLELHWQSTMLLDPSADLLAQVIEVARLSSLRRLRLVRTADANIWQQFEVNRDALHMHNSEGTSLRSLRPECELVVACDAANLSRARTSRPAQSGATQRSRLGQQRGVGNPPKGAQRPSATAGRLSSM